MKLFLFIASLFSVVSFSQNHKLMLQSGYNRIGVFINPNFGFDIKNHDIHIGLKVYGYNLFFESSSFGPRIGYQYVFTTESKKLYFYPSLSFSAYREQKSSSNLLLSELNFKYGLGINIGSNFSIVNEVGIGYIMSNTNLFNELKTIKSAYPSFEISLGLAYHFNKHTK